MGQTGELLEIIRKAKELGLKILEITPLSKKALNDLKVPHFLDVRKYRDQVPNADREHGRIFGIRVIKCGYEEKPCGVCHKHIQQRNLHKIPLYHLPTQEPQRYIFVCGNCTHSIGTYFKVKEENV